MKTSRIRHLFLFASVFLTLIFGSAVGTHAATVDTSTISGRTSDPYPVIVSGPAASIIGEAARYLGYPYVWGGNSLTNGCDCSHYVCLIYSKCGHGYSYRTSYGMRTFGTAVKSLSAAQAGDIICYNGHVAIYDGCGRIYEAMGAKWGIVHKRTADHAKILSIRRLISGKTTAKRTTAAKVLRTEVTANNVNMRTSKSMSSSSNIICKVPAGSTVYILSDESGWHKIKYAGKTGYMKTGYFKSQKKSTSTAAKVKSVTRYASGYVNMRRSPSLSGSIILKIPKGSSVSVTKTSNGWSYGTYKSRSGWIMSSYLKSSYSQAVKKTSSSSSSSKTYLRYTTANVNMRKTYAIRSGNVIMVVPKNAAVYVKKNYNGWSYITYKSRSGWIKSSYLNKRRT